jgi:hypothetical protein
VCKQGERCDFIHVITVDPTVQGAFKWVSLSKLPQFDSKSTSSSNSRHAQKAAHPPAQQSSRNATEQQVAMSHHHRHYQLPFAAPLPMAYQQPFYPPSLVATAGVAGPTAPLAPAPFSHAQGGAGFFQPPLFALSAPAPAWNSGLGFHGSAGVSLGPNHQAVFQPQTHPAVFVDPSMQHPVYQEQHQAMLSMPTANPHPVFLHPPVQWIGSSEQHRTPPQLAGTAPHASQAGAAVTLASSRVGEDFPYVAQQGSGGATPVLFVVQQPGPFYSTF